ncbi:hypothetical protein BFP72_10435 [Reichenbachiella sp. 5M10]|uniref:pectinesterase family protein n=1 Tax=Reichenbachiella sp. 5M10 TaxID=1889772 RepID=UPI000C1593BF|nr:pectinesterase family protein [Reichenbachiella sp. 5M10]PIB35780.1 hypothetical protein BFP72_10435 [Reichenbachiella sp. 5M10]
MKSIWIGLFVVMSILSGKAQSHVDVTVAQDGSGDYQTITEALEHLPMFTYERVVVFIKNGRYEEKIRITRDNLTLVGESRDSTVIAYSQLRSDWDAHPDVVGMAVVNVHADDLVLKNLTILNTQPEIGPHAFAIHGVGTRTILDHCDVRSKGGDTVSLWNYKDGMYYHRDCVFVGAVDFVCPRGWCYIDRSSFYEVKPTASIWHAAPLNPRQKFVIKNSSFDGVQGFQLGRHHYEAQFYLIDCQYSERMADQPIYRVTYPDQPARDRPYIWGERKYFYGSDQPGDSYGWLEDNLAGVDSLTAAWTFDQLWYPERMEVPRCLGVEIEEGQLVLYFEEEMTVRGELVLEIASGQRFEFAEGRGRRTLKFVGGDENMDFSRLSIVSGSLLPTRAYLDERVLDGEIEW